MDDVLEWTQACSSAFFDILHSCRRLMVFSTAFCSSSVCLWEFSGFTSIICRSLSELTLCRLEMKWNPYLFRRLFPVVAFTLKALWILPSDMRFPNWNSPSGLDYHFPNLHTAVLSDVVDPDLVHMLAAPSLRYFVLDISTKSCSEYVPFLRRNGKELQYLATPDACAAPSILQYCPKLVHWSTICAAIGMLRLKRAYQSIRFLTLSEDLPSRVSMLPMALRSLHSILSDAGSFTSLELIRFQLPLRTALRPILKRSNEHWEYSCARYGELFLRICKCRGIRVEVSFGIDEQSADVWQPLTREVSFSAGIQNCRL